MKVRKKNPTTAIGKAIAEAAQVAGGTSKLAKMIGAKNAQVIANWILRESVPPEFCKAIQHVTGIKASVLCPDVFYKGSKRPQATARP